MSFVTYFKSYPNPYYSDWRQAPVPGWGVRPVMAGPRMVAVGGFGAYSATATGCGTTQTDIAATQNALNELGYTDAEGKALVADGAFGPRSNQAFDKFKQRFAMDPKYKNLGITNPCDALFYDLGCKRDPSKCSATSAAPQQEGQPAPAAGAPSGLPIPPRTKPGDKGPLVIAWQMYLISQGYDLGPTGADGDHGQKTETASQDWEKRQAAAAQQAQTQQVQPGAQTQTAAAEQAQRDRLSKLLSISAVRDPRRRLALYAAIGRQLPQRPAPRAKDQTPAVAQQDAAMTMQTQMDQGMAPATPEEEVPYYKKPLFYVGVVAAVGVTGAIVYTMTRKA